MKLTRSTCYAISCMVHLARKGRIQPIPAKHIAAEEGIPLEYLLKILQQLTKADLLISIRGPQGGFILSRIAENITLLQIVQAIEGNLDEPQNELDLFSANLAAKVDQIYTSINTQTQQILAQITLESLV